ncbi:hypothetical protein SAMN04488032_11097 [Pacificibacter marinus]|uniref:Integrase catalytic domain-containing protein n=1 Tax=Pacificibacter marinus TaxID=658057 RepID=A0A1Y5SYI9_9RHOB|nr:hypothetical protein SAMN04488032_11097 [Pacificibacter marinus]SLN51651.1 hypothetical protein PAM7971_02560 [Pacificibacter marinus]
MAIAFRSPAKGIIPVVAVNITHTTIRMSCANMGLSSSMSGKGNRYDNVAVEMFFKTIKAELIWRDTWKAEMAIFSSHSAGQRNTSMDFIIRAAAI